jgi:hypothetical protein
VERIKRSGIAKKPVQRVIINGVPTASAHIGTFDFLISASIHGQYRVQARLGTNGSNEG